MPKIGVITEQGDLGFGFDPLSKKDQKQLRESTKNGQLNSGKQNKDGSKKEK